jgi:hypothetical protein
MLARPPRGAMGCARSRRITVSSTLGVTALPSTVTSLRS